MAPQRLRTWQTDWCNTQTKTHFPSWSLQKSALENDIYLCTFSFLKWSIYTLYLSVLYFWIRNTDFFFCGFKKILLGYINCKISKLLPPIHDQGDSSVLWAFMFSLLYHQYTAFTYVQQNLSIKLALGFHAVFKHVSFLKHIY